MKNESICNNCQRRFSCINNVSIIVKKCEFYEPQPDYSKLLDRFAGMIADKIVEQMKTEGEWLTEEPNSYTKRTYCSVCGKSAPFVAVSDDYYGSHMHGETEETKYCPNCGAKMKIKQL